MPSYLALTPEGFVDGLFTMDERAAAAHPLKPGYRLIVATPAVQDAVRMMGRSAVYRDGRFQILPETAAVKVEAARGMMLGTITSDRERRLLCRREGWWRRAVAEAGIEELGDDHPAWAGPAARDLPRPRCLVPFTDVELAPDLWVRQILTETDMADFQARVLASRLFDEGDEDTEVRTARWLYGPHALPLMATWRGEVLQYECYHFDENEIASGTARAGFNTHVDDQRPYWFWGILAQPAFQAIRAAGYTRMQAAVIADKPGYLDALKTFYGGQEIGRTPDGRWVRVEYDIDEAIALAPSWPARVTASVPGVVEVTLDAAVPLIEAAWGARPRKAEALRIAEKWWELDRATLLNIGGHVRAIRTRRQGEARLAVLTPIDQPLPAVAASLRLWCAAAGYLTLTSFIPDAQWRTPSLRGNVEQQGFRVVAERGGAVEVTVDV